MRPQRASRSQLSGAPMATQPVRPMTAMFVGIGRAGAISNDFRRRDRWLCRCVPQLLQGPRLDLSNPLGGHAQALTDLSQRLRRRAEPVMARQHGPLSLVEYGSEIPHLL